MPACCSGFRVMPLRRLVRLATRRLADGAGRAAAASGRAAHAGAIKAGAKRGRKPAKSAKAPPGRKGAPPPKRDAKAGARRRRPVRRPAPALGVLDALGFFLAAGLILASAPGLGAHAQAAAVAAAEPDRGRRAAHPLAIPAKGWRDILRRTWSNFNNDRIMATAGGVTFFSLLAVFPALAAFVSLYGLFFDRHDVGKQLTLVSGFIPHDIVAFFGAELTRISATGGGKLGFAFVISLLLSLWSGNGAVKALFGGLNVAYEERETRGFVHLTLLTLAFTFGGIAFALLAISAVVVAPAALAFLHVDAGGWWLAALRWPALLTVLALGLSVVYRYGPSRRQPRWRWITPGGLVAALLWLGASLLFSFYVSNFGSFDKTYGSLGAVVGFMTWLWYSTIIVLVGAELNAEIEHQTTVDTTVGGPRPPGARGAAMADTVGEAR